MTGTMELLHEHQGVVNTAKDTMSLFSKVPSGSSDNLDVKSKASEVMPMNPVASGDNVTTGYNSAHKLKDDMPSLIPCCEGKELQLNEELVRSGLSAISVKHDNNLIKCLSMSRACDIPQVMPGLVNHRNSFRSLHRPDLKRVAYLRRMSRDELETLFQGYASLPRSPTKIDVHDRLVNVSHQEKMAESTSRLPSKDTDHRDESHRVMIPPDENINTRDLLAKEAVHNEAEASILHPALERRRGLEDVPAGMRLHGAMARLYTSVLAGAKAGDQPEGSIAKEEYEASSPSGPIEAEPEDDAVPVQEELHIILPPRYEENTAGSSNTLSLDTLQSLAE